jgi:hypothetical protein
VNVDPQLVLTSSSAKMKQIAGFHFVYQLNQPQSAKKAEGVQRVDADINDKGEMLATVQYLSGGSLINVDLVAMSDTHYVKFPLATGWVKLKPSESPLENLNPAGLPIEILGEIMSPTMVGIENDRGRRPTTSLDKSRNRPSRVSPEAFRPPMCSSPICG